MLKDEGPWTGKQLAEMINNNQTWPGSVKSYLISQYPNCDVEYTDEIFENKLLSARELYEKVMNYPPVLRSFTADQRDKYVNHCNYFNKFRMYDSNEDLAYVPS